MERTFITLEEFYDYFGELPVQQEQFVTKLLIDTFNIILAKCEAILYYDWKNGIIQPRDFEFLQQAQQLLIGWFLENDFFAKTGSISSAQASKSLGESFDNNKEIAPLFYEMLEKTKYYSDYINVNNPNDILEDILPVTISSSNVRNDKDVDLDGINPSLRQIDTNQQTIIDNKAEVGELSDLDTDDKTSIVNAINEVELNTNINQQEIETLQNIIGQTIEETYETTSSGTFPLVPAEDIDIAANLPDYTTGENFTITNGNKVTFLKDAQIFVIEIVANITTSIERTIIFKYVFNTITYETPITIPAGTVDQVFQLPIQFDIAATEFLEMFFFVPSAGGTFTINTAPNWKFYFTSQFAPDLSNYYTKAEADNLFADQSLINTNLVASATSIFNPNGSEIFRFGNDNEIAMVSGTGAGLMFYEPGANVLDFNNKRLTKVADPTQIDDVATKNYSDNKFALSEFFSTLPSGNPNIKGLNYTWSFAFDGKISLDDDNGIPTYVPPQVSYNYVQKQYVDDTFSDLTPLFGLETPALTLKKRIDTLEKKITILDKFLEGKK